MEMTALVAAERILEDLYQGSRQGLASALPDGLAALADVVACAKDITALMTLPS